MKLRLKINEEITSNHDFSFTVDDLLLWGNASVNSNLIAIQNMQSSEVEDVSICGSGNALMANENGAGFDLDFSYDGVNISEVVNSEPFEFTTYELVEGQKILVCVQNVNSSGCTSAWVSANAIANLIPSEPIIEDVEICGTQDFTTFALIGNEGASIEFSLDALTVEQTANSDPYEFTTFVAQGTSVTFYARTLNPITGCVSPWVSAEISVNEINIDCPSDVTQNTAGGVCNAVVYNIAPIIMQDCGIINQTWTFTGTTTANSPTTGINNASGRTFNEGITTVICEISDNYGNSETCSFTVNIQDNELPVSNVTKLPHVTQNCILTVIGYTANDNCSGYIVGTTSYPTTYTAAGNYLITWTYSDASGNQSTQTQQLTVTNDDSIAETKDITIYLNDDGFASITPEDIDNGSDDDCEIVEMYLDMMEFNSTHIGENIVTLTVTDNGGNTDSKTAIVTVIWDRDIVLEILNFISPDGDGKNDLLEIRGIEHLMDFNLNIFNSLGEIVYKTDNYDNKWDATFNGKELPNGAYYNIFSKETDVYKGYVTVVI